MILAGGLIPSAQEDGGLTFEERDIRIEAGRVTEVGESLQAEEVHDASGTLVLPGMTNGHCHTAMALLRGAAEDVTLNEWFNDYIWKYESNLTEEDVRTGTLLGGLEMLLAGVTGVADHYFHLPAALSAYEELGMRANMASTLFGVGDGVEEHFQGALEEIDHYSRESRPRLRLSLGPHSTYLCPPPFLERVAHEARERELPIHIHVSETAQQVSHSREEHGLTPVELLDTAGCLTKRTLLAHAYFATDRDLELIAERGAAVVHCPKTFMKFGIANDFLPRAVEKGVTLALGTDGAASNSTLDLLEAARDAALLAKVVTKDPHRGRIREILPMLWGAGSFAAGPEAPSIREGMPADLVLYEANTPNLIPRQNLEAHLLYSLSSRAVRDVFVGGELLIRERRHTRLDESELFAHAEEAYVRLVGGGGAERIQTFRG